MNQTSVKGVEGKTYLGRVGDPLGMEQKLKFDDIT